MSKVQILVVDDDVHILKAIERALTREQMQVTTTANGKDTLDLVNSQSYDLLILDVLLPDIDGFDLIKQLREEQNHIPVLMLSGQDQEYHNVLGLEFGADDYMTKPFSVPILLSKIRALIRRNVTYARTSSVSTSSDQLIAGPFRLNRRTFRLYKNNHLLDLTARELILLQFFMENPFQVFSKGQLYTQIWNNHVVDDNTIMVYIRRLRNKIEDIPSQPQYLKTVWGIGYQLII